MDIIPLIPYASLVLAAYAAFTGHFMSKDEAKRESRLELLEKQTALFWKMVEQHMTTVLHSPHTPDLDVYLERYRQGENLGTSEVKDFSRRLLTMINDPKELQGNRTSAVFLLAALNLRYKLGIDPTTPFRHQS